MDLFIVDKIIMMARPSYPFLEELKRLNKLTDFVKKWLDAYDSWVEIEHLGFIAKWYTVGFNGYTKYSHIRIYDDTHIDELHDAVIQDWWYWE